MQIKLACIMPNARQETRIHAILTASDRDRDRPSIVGFTNPPWLNRQPNASGRPDSRAVPLETGGNRGAIRSLFYAIFDQGWGEPLSLLRAAINALRGLPFLFFLPRGIVGAENDRPWISTPWRTSGLPSRTPEANCPAMEAQGADYRKEPFQLAGSLMNRRTH